MPLSHGLTAWGGQGARGEALASCSYDAPYAGCDFIGLHAAGCLDCRALANGHAPYSGWWCDCFSFRTSCAEDDWPYAGRHLSVIMVNGRRRAAIVPRASAERRFFGLGLCDTYDGSTRGFASGGESRQFILVQTMLKRYSGQMGPRPQTAAQDQPSTPLNAKKIAW